MQQGCTVQHRELCSVFLGSLDGRSVWERMDPWVCMAESRWCPPKTITTWLSIWTVTFLSIGYCCCSVVSYSLWSHGLQHSRLPCRWLSPEACSNSCPLSQWCHPTISSSVIPFSSNPQSSPASRSFHIKVSFSHQVAKVLEIHL